MFCPQFVGSYPHFVGFIPFFVGFKLKTSRNNCLVFSHSENSPKYSECDVKYDELNSLYNSKISSGWPTLNAREYVNNQWNSYNGSVQKVIIENKIKPLFTNNYFKGCNRLKNIEGIDNIDTSNCEDMSGMFQEMGTAYFTSLNLSSWNVSKVTSMRYMFSNNSLNELNLNGWDTSNVTDFRYMFYINGNLRTITYGDGFVKNASARTDNMFQSCPANKPSWY